MDDLGTHDVDPAVEGKPVIDANGDRLGRVVRVEDGRAVVDPNDDVATLTMRVLGWEEGEGTYTLMNSRVAEVTDEAVHLKGNL